MIRLVSEIHRLVSESDRLVLRFDRLVLRFAHLVLQTDRRTSRFVRFVDKSSPKTQKVGMNLGDSPCVSFNLSTF